MPLKFKKGFVNTLSNIKEGKELDLSEPIYIDLAKKKGQEGYDSEFTIQFKFKRKILVNNWTFEI